MNRACKNEARPRPKAVTPAEPKGSGDGPTKFNGRENMRAPANPVNRAKSRNDQ